MRAHEPKAGDDSGATTNNSGALTTSLAKLGLLGDGLGAPGGSLLPTSRVTITARPDGKPAAPPRRSGATAVPDPDGTGKAPTGGATAGPEVGDEPKGPGRLGVRDEPEGPGEPEVHGEPDEEPGSAAVAADTGPLRLDPAALLPARV